MASQNTFEMPRMRMSSRVSGALTLLFVLGLTMAEPARAGLITQTSDFSVTTAQDGPVQGLAYYFLGFDSLTFELFDTQGSTRTLTDVRLSWDTAASGASLSTSAFMLANDNGTAAISVKINADFNIELIVVGEQSSLSSTSLSDEAQCTDQTLGDLFPCLAPASVDAEIDGSASGIVPSFATDGLSFFNIDMIIDGVSTLNPLDPVNTAAYGWSEPPTGTWDGTFTVEYSYRESAGVPAPATLLLFGLGLAAMRFSYRRYSGEPRRGWAEPPR